VDGDFDDHGVRQLDVAALGVVIVVMLFAESVLDPTVARFRNLAGPGEGEMSRSLGVIPREERFSDDMADVGMPTCTGAEEPLNQEARPRERSSTLMTPSLSPVRVGMKSSSPAPTCSSFPLVLEGLLLLLLLLCLLSGLRDFDFGETIAGRKEAKLLCVFARDCLVGLSSSQKDWGEVCPEAGGEGNAKEPEFPSNLRSESRE
jgi:hypothetical protein